MLYFFTDRHTAATPPLITPLAPSLTHSLPDSYRATSSLFTSSSPPLPHSPTLPAMQNDSDYSLLGPTPAHADSSQLTRRRVVAGVLALYGVLLVVLLALYGSVSDCDGSCDSSSSSSSGAVGSFSSVAALSAAQVGLAASLSATGTLQLGAGTSVYQDLYQLPAVCAKATAMEPVFDSSYVMTFIDGVKGTLADCCLCWSDSCLTCLY
jgi:hypothetical protein